MIELASDVIREVVERALREDVGAGDLTTLAAVPAAARATARFVYREPGVLCGLPVLEAVFAAVEPALTLEAHAVEGAQIARGAAAPPTTTGATSPCRRTRPTRSATTPSPTAARASSSSTRTATPSR